MRKWIGWLGLLLAVALGRTAIAHAELVPGRDSYAALSKPLQFVTQHRATIRGKSLGYTATAGETFISDVQGKPNASIFSFSYVADGPLDHTRPVTFVFNGGPGSSSIWLHMGVIGPRRVVLSRDVNPSVLPPFIVDDNPDSILDVTDLVFIDPVGTGFSHAIGETKPEYFYSVDTDANSVAQFIELWLTKNGRWNSPKYVIGESYGSVRAAVMPRALLGGPTYMGVMRGITLNGIVMLGTVMDARDGDSRSADLIAVLALPTMADTAWYHNKIDRRGRSLAAFDAEANLYARGDYLAALAKSSAGLLSTEEAQAVAVKLSNFTGLSPEFYMTHKLRLDAAEFHRQILGDQGLEVGMYDSRYTLPHAHTLGDNVADDPAMAQYVPGFVAAFHDMLKTDLKVEMPMPYNSITWAGLSAQWNWNRTGVPKGQSFAVDLANGMRRNPGMHVLVASGYYDLITPAASARNAMEQAGMPADRTTFKIYESGHLLYLGGTAPAFAGDLRALIASSH